MNNSEIDIIVVEDNKLFRETLCSFVAQSSGMVCNNTYSSCEDALIAILKFDLNPDVILLDIGLPGMSGVEGIKHFNKLIPDIKIIIQTIHDDNENIFNALCNGASGYLLKDSSSEKIISSIKEVLNGGAPMNSAIASKVLKMFKDFVPEHKDYQLSQREIEILKLLTEGLSKKQIAEKLFISHHTVDSHIRKIYDKLEVHSSNAAVAKAVKENLV
jgi:DNA-binding NarL/FixJ family response regulator